jgi:hypothetical protein
MMTSIHNIGGTRMTNQQPFQPDIIEVFGAKYQRVEEPKPQTLYDALIDDFDSEEREIICDNVSKWLGDDIEVDTEEYNRGWNAGP